MLGKNGRQMGILQVQVYTNTKEEDEVRLHETPPTETKTPAKTSNNTQCTWSIPKQISS